MAFVGSALRHVHVTEVVGPAHLGWRECLRVEVTRLRCLEVLGGEQEIAHFSVCRTQFDGRRGAVLDLRRQRPIPIGHLLLDRFVHAREVGQRHRRQLVSVGRRSSARGRHVRRRTAAADEHETQHQNHWPQSHIATETTINAELAGDHLPSPCFSVVYRSIATPLHSSAAPSGHTTRTRDTFVDCPSPTSTRGSLAEA